jgi:hypothetical protein
VRRDRPAQGSQSTCPRIRATAEKKRKGGETAVRIEQISALVLHEIHER